MRVCCPRLVTVHSMRYSQQEPAFSHTDVGKTVEIRGGNVTVNGVGRFVKWGDAKHADCKGKIGSVDEALHGAVNLLAGAAGEKGAWFENPEDGKDWECVFRDCKSVFYDRCSTVLTVVLTPVALSFGCTDYCMISHIDRYTA